MKQDVRMMLGRLPVFSGLDLTRSSLEFIGGVTNQSYRVTLGGQSWVVRIPGSAAQRLVDRTAEHHNATAVAGLGLTIPNLWFDPETGIKVSRWVASAVPLSHEEIREPGQLTEIAALLRVLHRSGAPFETAFAPRLAFSRCERMLLAGGQEVPALMRSAQESYQRCCQLLDSSCVRLAPCHQDLWRENLVRVDGHLLLIDWEHSAPGEPLYDLADLAVQADLPPDREQFLLQSYFAGPPKAPQLARFWMSKALSRFVWGAWALTRATAESSSTSAETGARKLAQAMEFMDSRDGRDSARVLML